MSGSRSKGKPETGKPSATDHSSSAGVQLPAAPEAEDKRQATTAELGRDAPADQCSMRFQTMNAIDVPLVINSDDTLFKVDIFAEALLALLRHNPVLAMTSLARACTGRNGVRKLVLRNAQLDATSWPVNDVLLEYLEREAKSGRRIVFLTKGNGQLAASMKARFRFVDEVVQIGAHDGDDAEIARRLQDRFPDGYIYAGASRGDFPAWQASEGAVLVATSCGLKQEVSQLGIPVQWLPAGKSGRALLRRCLRLHQWAKNLLVFVPLVLGGKALDPTAWMLAMLGFVALSLVASATYIANDLWDLQDDRRHAKKRKRPFAAGDVPIHRGLLLAFACLVIGLFLVGITGPKPFGVLLVYIALTLSYTAILKRFPIVDVCVLAGLFTLRLLLGIALTDVFLSPWLLVFSMMLFLSLSLAKRHTEILRFSSRGVQTVSGRGYVAADAPLTGGLGMASMIGAIVIMVLYLIDDALEREAYMRPEFLWVTPLILFLFLSRVWLLAQRGQMRDDPVTFALRDRISVLLGFVLGVCLLLALFGTG